MYRSRLEKDLRHWAGLGLVSEPAVAAMLTEFDQRESSFSLGRVLMLIAALLIAASVLLLVAANWEAISRPLRVGLILGLIWCGYGAGAVFQMRGARVLAQCCQLVATVSFGGAIALVGQMYHLSGDAADALAIWFAVSCLAAALFRMPALTTLSSVLLAALFATLVFDDAYIAIAGQGAWYVPLALVIVLALVRYTGADRTRHIVYLTMITWFGWLYSEVDAAGTAIAYVAIGAAGFLLSVLPVSPLSSLASRTGAAPAFYSYLLGALGLLALHLSFDLASTARSTMLGLGIVTLVYALGGIALAGRLNGPVRYLAYLIFAVECFYLASETVGSILGTSGFFLLSGFGVALLAFLVVRIEKRLSDRRKEMTA
ncbi:DUF2157 domain-containing protein [Rhizobium sp. SG2393]|uniref:DUF2157 domain-containing protein n=1 Tax=Rhizobium sp. SG2393 TaxID=3276279 RepID=UPI0036701832